MACEAQRHTFAPSNASRFKHPSNNKTTVEIYQVVALCWSLYLHWLLLCSQKSQNLDADVIADFTDEGLRHREVKQLAQDLRVADRVVLSSAEDAPPLVSRTWIQDMYMHVRVCACVHVCVGCTDFWLLAWKLGGPLSQEVQAASIL